MNTSSARVPAGRSSQRLRPRRPKTFSGCGTCRSRHLKCDEARPSCQRCIDAQLGCAGYPGYRAEVLWKPVKSPSSYRGQARPSRSTSNDTAAQCNAQDAPPYRSNTSHIQSLSLPRLDHILPELPSPNETELCHTTAFQPYLPAPSTSLAPATTRNRQSNLILDTVERHLDRLGEMNLQVQLIEHWMNHLSDALMPIPGPYNPIRNIFIPIAYAGARSPASTSSGPVALFYLICAFSAFHLSANTTDEKQSTQFMTLALSHHNKGIRHLQNSLVRDISTQRESVLASLLVCLMYEPATVEQSFWRNHLRGASQWLRRIDVHAFIQTESTAALYQIFAATTILLRSQMLSIPMSLTECIGYDPELFSGPYHLHRFFGLPKPLLEAISEMVNDAAHLRQKANASSESAGFLSPEVLDKREMELYLCAPQYPAEGLVMPSGGGLVYHHSWIFYFASLIYFKRFLRNTAPDAVQLLIEQALYHIEALEKCTTRPSSPVTWPIAVIFFEAQDLGLQQRAMVWLDFIIKQSTLSVWQRAKPLFSGFWARRQEPGCTDIHWDIYLDDPSLHGIMMF